MKFRLPGQIRNNLDLCNRSDRKMKFNCRNNEKSKNVKPFHPGLIARYIFWLGDSHISATNFLLYWTPPLRQPCPLWGRGACDSYVLTVYLIPGYKHHRNQGAIVAGQKPLSDCVFGPWTETLFRSEFWNTILIIFSLVISFTGW